jgi:hypothetical protein
MLRERNSYRGGVMPTIAVRTRGASREMIDFTEGDFQRLLGSDDQRLERLGTGHRFVCPRSPGAP